MHPFSALTLGIFVAGYTTARWDLVTRLYELAIFAWDYGVVVSRMSPMPLSRIASLCSLGPSCILTETASAFTTRLTCLSSPSSCVPPTDSSYSRYFSSSYYSLWHVWRQESQTWYDQFSNFLCLFRRRIGATS